MLNAKSIAALALIGLVTCAPAFAADEWNTSAGHTAAGAPLGLHGVDPVAFINLGNRIEGSATFTETHDGVAYYFASKDNAEAFKKNPGKYAPQNGGYCTYGVSVGKKFDGNPRYADVVNGKLYVFLNEEIYKAYQKDTKGTISKASDSWKKIQHKAVADL
ncbi:MAG: hypothetical protein MI750_11555 [Xanthomonadales bacterium]|nr:hypothetical protein [Xanthomonadales bacterium]